MPIDNHFLPFAIQTARAAGQIIRDGAQGDLNAKQKGVRDFLTDIDLAAEQAIVQAIRQRYPEHDILTEETPADQRRSRYQWVIDPVDGTSNLMHRFPCFSTSIALCCDDQPIAGVVFDPIREHMFAAALGDGATLNGNPLRVSRIQDWIYTQIGMDWSRQEAIRAQILRVIAELTAHSGSIRCCGSAALGICYVAAGWWDAYFHLQLSAWDAAAGALIVREAGGEVTDVAGQRWQPGVGPCLASNGSLHDRFCAHVRAGAG